jgi:hypothetical protein
VSERRHVDIRRRDAVIALQVMRARPAVSRTHRIFILRRDEETRASGE